VTTPHAPNEWHPAYNDHRDVLLDWLEGRRPGNPYELYLPRLSPQLLRFEPYDPAAPIRDMLPKAHRLVRNRATRPVPYIGRPCVYAWWYAVDELGRGIAGPGELIYASADYFLCYGPFEYAPEARNGHDPDTPVWP
jgi:hypothetical protein